MDEKGIRTGLDKLIEEEVRIRNHQVRLQWQTSHLPQGLDDWSAERNVGHEVSVHHIDMDAVGPGLLGLGHLLTQPGKISRENRRSQLHCAVCYVVGFLFFIHKPRSDVIVNPRKRSKTGADNISSVQRQRQLPSVLPGRVIRASAPRLSKSCNGAMASPATEDHARRISSHATSSLLPAARFR